jgi:NADH:ubiquinone oxidoreductase subunit K
VTITLLHFQVLSAALFSIGIYGVLARRSAILILLSLELMLNAVNINLIAYASYIEDIRATGQVIAIFVITVAAAEVGLAMAIILRLFRNRASVDVGEVDLMKW